MKYLKGDASSKADMNAMAEKICSEVLNKPVKDTLKKLGFSDGASPKALAALCKEAGIKCYIYVEYEQEVFLKTPEPSVDEKPGEGEKPEDPFA